METLGIKTCVRILILKDNGDIASDTTSILNDDWKNHLKVLYLPGFTGKHLDDLKKFGKVNYPFENEESEKYLVDVSLIKISKEDLTKLLKQQSFPPSSPCSAEAPKETPAC